MMQEPIEKILEQLGERTLEEFQADFYSLVSQAYKKLSERDFNGAKTRFEVAFNYAIMSLLGKNEMIDNWESVLGELEKRLKGKL